jgi:NADH/F420H2 dehydrogenase subunit C
MSNEQEKLSAYQNELSAAHPEAIIGTDLAYGDTVWTVDRRKIIDVLAWLKERRFDLLLDIDGVDALYLGRLERFEVVYILYSILDNLRLRVKVTLPESGLELPTATGLWQSANWAEREVFDMFGVVFKGHPNLKRILCHHEFEGHALRKDYPVMGEQWCSSARDMLDDLKE